MQTPRVYAPTALLGAAFALSLAACATAPARPEGAAAPRRYGFVVNTRPCGESVTRVEEDGTRRSEVAIVNNGRGPKYTTRARLAPDGTLASFEAQGTETFGGPIDERFALEGGLARWKSTQEQGERKLSRPAFYLPMAGGIDATALLAAALARAGGRIDLLPEGEARLEKESELDLDVGGRRRHVTSFLILGVDLLPQRVWLDDDGSLFGVVDAGFSAVLEGWQDAASALVEAQKPLEAQRASDLARKHSHPPPLQGLAIVNARVFDSAAKAWLPAHTVIVKGDRIEALGPSASLAPPAGAQIIDAQGKALLPGLWDTHAHLSRGEGELAVASGITSLRDVGNDPDWLDEQKRRFDEGAAIGPRLVRGGFVEGRGPNAAGSSVTAETEEEARAAVAFFAKRGYEELKIYNSIKPSLVPVLADEAHQRGMRVSGHVPVGMLAAGAVKASFDEIQHINQAMLNFFADEKTDTATLLRFTLIAENGAALDLNGAPVREFVALLREKKTVVTPTLTAFEDMFLQKPGELSRSILPIARRVPPMFRRQWMGEGLKIPPGKEETWRAGFPSMQKFTRMLWESGVTLTAGTDSLSGLVLPHELELLVEAGLPAADVLQMATLGAAKTLWKQERSGSIAPGKDADLVLVDGDPTTNIGDVRRVITVVKAGVVYDSAAILEAMGVKRW
ncbi:MAG TPA: amidohydrolase family protein [Myxococcales bacterium]|jgi:imidazolonepropionase-like amidohydrolase